MPLIGANLPDYVKDLCERVRKNFFLVTRNLTRAAEKQEIRGERSCRRKNIQVGDLVFLYTPVVGQGKVKKFSSFNKGPYRVIEKFNDVNFLIQNVNKSTDIQRVHINRLTLCKERIIFPSFNEKENFDVVEKAQDIDFRPHNIENVDFSMFRNRHLNRHDITVRTRPQTRVGPTLRPRGPDGRAICGGRT